MVLIAQPTMRAPATTAAACCTPAMAPNDDTPAPMAPAIAPSVRYEVRRPTLYIAWARSAAASVPLPDPV